MKTVCVSKTKELLLLFGTVTSYCQLLADAWPLQPIIKDPNLKYILMWTDFFHIKDMVLMVPEGQQFFIHTDCPVKSCYFSWNGNYLLDITEFDALLFHGPNSVGKSFQQPEERTPEQLYIFINKEAPTTYQMCDTRLDNLFNLSFTYRLDSDIKYYYLTVKDKSGEVIGPNKVMHWINIEDMLPIDEEIKEKLKSKSKAVAWLASHCITKSGREVIVERLQKELQKYELSIDIYGKCGQKKCGITEAKSMLLNYSCWNFIQAEYFFYLSFENSLSEDYVTEKLLNPLIYYTVPIVFGGANYTRFMPDGIYLDARKMSVKQLAREIHNFINDKERYYKFFKWHNHYSYHDPFEDPGTEPFCMLCEHLNKENLTKSKKTYNKLINWWQGPHECIEEQTSSGANENPKNLVLF